MIRLPLGPLQTNCWLVVDDERGQLAIVDPGEESELVVAAIEETGATPVAIWLTHAHFDHVGAVEELVRVFDIPVHLHAADAQLYGMCARQAAAYGLRIEQPTADTIPMVEGDELAVGDLRFTVMHAPGHAPGHVVLHGHGIALAGDCLFAGSIGRTDLPLSDPGALMESLQRITALPPETRVLPGHGDPTTVEAELRTNPFLTGAARLRVS